MSNTLDEVVQNRRRKLDALRESNSASPNGFKVSTTIETFNQLFKNKTQEELEANNEVYSIGGRIKLHRVMGKTSFCHISDEGGSLQLYLKRENEEGDGGIPRDQYNPFKKFDLGDIIGVTGVCYRTNKGELSLKVKRVKLLAKSLLPLPDKHHGLADQEMCWRQRYVDLMVNEDSMETFRARSKVVSGIREFMESGGFTEVETPMMHPIPGGATARPFITHHNTLDMELYLRIAPELYLKRLIVGGFTKVYEINRNFRNEGLSPKHNPEFTMMEFYSAFWDYRDLMNFTECLIQYVAERVTGDTTLPYGEHQLNFGQDFQVITMEEAVIKYAMEGNSQAAKTYASLQEWWGQRIYDGCSQCDEEAEISKSMKIPPTKGEAIALLFDEYVEHQLIQPTFITQFPVEISPLARRNDDDPTITDRFELFIAGQEIANGFSELNDPDDQAERFKAQVAALESGDKEAMHYDEDYITALQYGMPPTAGEGIGIDRLVAILLNKANIRDVILFPQMRPNAKSS
jgi:lysyl-tRNA synthetase class 2